MQLCRMIIVDAALKSSFNAKIWGKYISMSSCGGSRLLEAVKKILYITNQRSRKGGFAWEKLL